MSDIKAEHMETDLIKSFFMRQPFIQSMTSAIWEFLNGVRFFLSILILSHQRGSWGGGGGGAVVLERIPWTRGSRPQHSSGRGKGANRVFMKPESHTSWPRLRSGPLILSQEVWKGQEGDLIPWGASRSLQCHPFVRTATLRLPWWPTG